MAFKELDEVKDDNRLIIPKPLKILGLLLVVVGIGYAIVVANTFREPDPRFAEGELLRQEEEPSGDDDHEYLRFADDVPAKQSPKMVSLSELPDQDLASREVIGVANGEIAYAFVIKDFDPERNTLIVATMLGDRSLVITYNYRKKLTRVLTNDSTELIDVRLGGADYFSNLVLLYKDVRYQQDSEELPLDDYDYTVTTLDKWAQEHPNTLVNFDEELTKEDWYRT